MRISDWSSDVCSSDLVHRAAHGLAEARDPQRNQQPRDADREERRLPADETDRAARGIGVIPCLDDQRADEQRHAAAEVKPRRIDGERGRFLPLREIVGDQRIRSEEHTSELQSLMRISYAVFCLKKTKTKNQETTTRHQ